MEKTELAQTTQPVSAAERWWRRRYSRAGALKLGAAAGASLGLSSLDHLHTAQAPEAQAATSEFSGTLSTLFNFSPRPGLKVPAQFLKAYTTLHPQVQFNSTAKTCIGDPAWISTRMMVDHVPDIFEPCAVNNTLDGVPKKWWVALDPYLDKPNPYVKGNKRWRDLIVPGLLDQGKYLDNKTYVFCADVSEWGIFYNKDIFKKAKVSPPETWAELMAVSKKLTAAGYGAFSLYQFGFSEFSIVVESMLWAGAFKSRADEPYFMSPLDFCRAVKSGKLVKTAQRTRDAWQLIKAFSAYWPTGSFSAKDNLLFTTGKAAMWYAGSWDITTQQQAIGDKFELGFFPIPRVTKESSPLAIGDSYTGIGAMASGDPISIPTSAARNGHLDLAVDFLMFMTQPQWIRPLALEQVIIPAVIGAQGTLPPLLKAVAEQVVPKQSLLGPVYIDLATELSSKQNQYCQGYLTGANSLDTALMLMDQVNHSVATTALANAGLS
jgi:ABC-type glycerol-3-phosphate transport system substrate-binding protein